MRYPTEGDADHHCGQQRGREDYLILCNRHEKAFVLFSAGAIMAAVPYECNHEPY
jgi:hypothetical protein